jgi:hypothetical protein
MAKFVKVEYKAKLSKDEIKQIWQNRQSCDDRCPFCEERHIEGESVDVEVGGATQECSCPHCGAQWRDCYDLSNIQIVI